MSSSKRNHDQHHHDGDEEEPWWERDRRGDTVASSGTSDQSRRGGQGSDRRYDDNRNSYRSNRGNGRGGNGEYSHPPRRNDFNQSRGSSYSQQRQYPNQPPPPRHALEEGEIMLNYSDTPVAPPPSAPRGPSRSAAPPSSYHNNDSSYPRNSPPRRYSPIPPRRAASPSPALAPSTSTAVMDDDTTPLNLDPVEEPDPEKVLAERRRKRAEILAKYAKEDTKETPASSTPISSAVESVKQEETIDDAGTPGRSEVERAAKRLKLGTDSPAVSTVATNDPSRATSVELGQSTNFTLLKDSDEEQIQDKKPEVHKSEVTGEDEVEVSAADYNPDFDRREDERRMERLEEKARKEQEDIVIEEEEDGEDDEEGDEDDDDDMFAIGTDEKKEKKKTKKKSTKNGNVPVVNRNADASTLANPSLLADNFDDAEGYYKVILGEVLDGGRYLVQANLGKGMFSSVVKAKDLGEDGKGVKEGDRKEVAIKMVRSQESMFKAGLKEAQILRRLMDADPDDKKHLIRLLRTFEHRGHLCLVFESLSMNLREVVKRYGKDVGLNLRAVRAYASQMFMALALMKKCELMHADLKPDNILVNESKSTLKVCDLGSASDVSENDITPYLVSRFYRAPEIILGLPYDCSLDVWSIGCTLYELYTGKILFPGRTNNHMLLLMMETKGKFQNKVIKKARFGDQHFDENQNFLSHEKNDTITPRQIPSKPPSDIRTRLMPAGTTRKLKDDEVRLLGNFVDLLEKMLSLEPQKRPLPKDLLSHPFIRG